MHPEFGHHCLRIWFAGISWHGRLRPWRDSGRGLVGLGGSAPWASVLCL